MSDELYSEAMIGQDAEEFLTSDVGKFLIGCADQEIQEAMDQLKKCHPWRHRRIRELQNKIWRAESVQGWLAELITRGRQAMQQLEEREE
jgi:hypothetical protein